MARHGWLDTPGARSSHARPTPTGGGVGIAAGLAVGLAALSLLGLTYASAETWAALLGALAMSVIGALDDRAALGARFKLALGAGVALAVGLAMPPVAGLALAPGVGLPLPWEMALLGEVLWLVTATNAVNFMDGADGLVPGGLLIASAALALAAARAGAPDVAVAAALACAAYAGFLPWNLAGRLFQGDAGSLSGGFLLSALALVTAERGVLPLLFGPTLLLPWLTDVLLTLLRRARGGRRLLDAHREHLYQRWLQATGRPHLALAARNAALGVAAALAAGLLCLVPVGWETPLFALLTAACVAGWSAAGRALERAEP